jgi:hypothetical protein
MRLADRLIDSERAQRLGRRAWRIDDRVWFAIRLLMRLADRLADRLIDSERAQRLGRRA